MALFHYFLWLSNSPLCTGIFFIHSSIDRHLVGFHVLAVVNSAAVNIELVVIWSLSHVQLLWPTDHSLPGSSVHGFLQARILEWVAISFFKNIELHVSFWILVFIGYMLRSGIAGSYGSSIFSFVRKLHTVLHCGCTSFLSHNGVGGLPFLHSLFSSFLNTSLCTILY